MQIVKNASCKTVCEIDEFGRIYIISKGNVTILEPSSSVKYKITSKKEIK